MWVRVGCRHQGLLPRHRRRTYVWLTFGVSFELIGDGAGCADGPVRSGAAGLVGRLWHAAAQHPVLWHGHLGVTGGRVQRHAVVQTHVLRTGRPRQRRRAAPFARTLDRCGHRGHLRCIRGACVRGLGQCRIDSRKRTPWHHHEDRQGQERARKTVISPEMADAPRQVHPWRDHIEMINATEQPIVSISTSTNPASARTGCDGRPSHRLRPPSCPAIPPAAGRSAPAGSGASAPR